MADALGPERLKLELALGDAETFEAQAALSTAQAGLTKFMVAEHGAEIHTETLSKFSQTFARALACGRIGDADESRVARIIAVGDRQVGLDGSFQDMVEQFVVTERITQPEVLSVKSNENSL